MLLEKDRTMLTVSEVALMWDLSKSTVAKWVSRDVKKRPLRPGSFRKTKDGYWLIEYGAVLEKLRRAPEVSLDKILKGADTHGQA